ncbi:C-factor-like isoform X2 [Biomphalaria glabrata]|uniref:C-factor-like isoform X2 n=1 Tax=Biomphalaria glabrata TaxID=6526 RepID=A0A9W2YCI8_BIOGL|nr:C-factor-like isoform X2 [Biomphalaria glabrata]XP_055860376.1 C-factor-like isoform X2 [Biomphalaria glabrata]XP_055860445.1 C-factor-like isoform X2 [Biomphalaria glabrata]
MSAVCLVQGASRGIGLQFCKALLMNNKTQVIATCRKPLEATDLQQLMKDNSQRLSVLNIDVTNEGTISAAASQVEQSHGKLDLLINCAGIIHPSKLGETSLKAVTSQGLLETYLVNSVGPLLMAKHFAALLSKGQGLIGKQAADKKSQHSSVLVNMSAKVGSISDNALGGWYSYRMSKAALNMATRNLSIELTRGQKKTVCIALHPGTVDTDLSRPYHKNVPKLLTAQQTVEFMLSVINSLSLEDSGKFFTYERSVLPF